MKTNSAKSTSFSSTRTLIMTGMCTAIIAVLSQISFPLPSGVPVTLQTFAIALTGFLLGWKSGLFSTLTYLILGMIGVPVFANFKGGAAIIFQKTGGFLIGFLFMTLLCGLGIELMKKYNIIFLIVFSALGLFVCHMLGILQFSFLAHMGFYESALLVSIPYLVKDIISVILAYFFAISIQKVIKIS